MVFFIGLDQPTLIGFYLGVSLLKKKILTLSFTFEPNSILFGSKSSGKHSSRSYSTQFESKYGNLFLWVCYSLQIRTLVTQ